MQAPRRVVLATGNAGKLREIAALLAPRGFEIVSQAELGIDGAEETGSTFEDNALLKARHAARAANLPALADDSGIEVDALGGGPGVYSARYAGEDASDEANLDKLLAALSGLAPAQCGARYRCVIVYVASADDPAPLVGEGNWPGRIIGEKRGSGGFGYDPSFVPEGDHRTVAEMPAAEKNLKSHRAQAMNAFLAKFSRALPR